MKGTLKGRIQKSTIVRHWNPAFQWWAKIHAGSRWCNELVPTGKVDIRTTLMCLPSTCTLKGTLKDGPIHAWFLQQYSSTLKSFQYNFSAKLVSSCHYTHYAWKAHWKAGFQMKGTSPYAFLDRLSMCLSMWCFKIHALINAFQMIERHDIVPQRDIERQTLKGSAFQFVPFKAISIWDM